MLKLSALEQSLLWWSRYLFFSCNFLLLTLGAGILSILIVTQLEIITLLTILNEYEYFKLTVALVSSVILILTTFLGAYATIKLSLNELVIYSLLLLAVLANSIAYVVWSYINADYSKGGDLYRQLYFELRHYDQHKTVVDNLQSALQCCGINGVADWNITDDNLPMSCCGENKKSCSINSPSLHLPGCFDILRPMLLYIGWAVIGCVLFISIIAIITLLLTLPQCQAIKYIAKQRKEAEELSLKIPRVTTVLPTNDEEKTAEETVENVEPAENAEPDPAEENNPEDQGSSEEPSQESKQESNVDTEKQDNNESSSKSVGWYKNYVVLNFS